MDTFRKKYYQYLFPEPTNHPLSVDKTIVYPNNQYAIAGRNPVRIIVIPYDKFGLVTTLPSNTTLKTPDLANSMIIQGKRYFFDVNSTRPVSENVVFDFAGKYKSIKIYFAPNCKRELKTCLKNPQYLWWYGNAIFGDKLRQLIYKEKQ